MYSYKELKVYTESMVFVVMIYKLTATFPNEEKFGLITQMQRCAVSIPSNIAEGSGRKNTREFIQFRYIANGSLSEIETQIELSRLLGYINDTTELINKISYIRKMLMGLIHKLETNLK
jgi:four helix bundle protein